MKVFFSEQADSDLLQIITYLAERNRAAAVELAASFDSAILNLSRFPLIGRDRSPLAPSLRSILVRSYLVFYHVDGEALVVVRVLDGRRDIEAEFLQ
jgi:toxin ParE1/3/4